VGSDPIVEGLQHDNYRLASRDKELRNAHICSFERAGDAIATVEAKGFQCVLARRGRSGNGLASLVNVPAIHMFDHV
jgi:hypothetical protein